jgi:ABC-type sugar transport system permease subunit
MYAGMTTVYYVYMMGIGGGPEGQGKSSAAAWILALLIIALTRLNFKLGDIWVNYD